MAQTKSTRPTPSLKTMEWLLDEAIEGYHELEQLREKLRKQERGSETYFELMAEIAASADVIRVKTIELLREIKAIEETMPDDD